MNGAFSLVSLLTCLTHTHTHCNVSWMNPCRASSFFAFTFCSLPLFRWVPTGSSCPQEQWPMTLLVRGWGLETTELLVIRPLLWTSWCFSTRYLTQVFLPMLTYVLSGLCNNDISYYSLFVTMATVTGTEAHELVKQEVRYMFLNSLLLQHQHVQPLLLKSSVTWPWMMICTYYIQNFIWTMESTTRSQLGQSLLLPYATTSYEYSTGLPKLKSLNHTQLCTEWCQSSVTHWIVWCKAAQNMPNTDLYNNLKPSNFHFTLIWKKSVNFSFLRSWKRIAINTILESKYMLLLNNTGDIFKDTALC